MSFLSSHRLHWGVHHELSDNFRIQLDQMIQDATAAFPEGGVHNGDSSANSKESSPPADQELEALGP
jgi:hypothetical protein